MTTGRIQVTIHSIITRRIDPTTNPTTTSQIRTTTKIIDTTTPPVMVDLGNLTTIAIETTSFKITNKNVGKDEHPTLCPWRVEVDYPAMRKRDFCNILLINLFNLLGILFTGICILYYRIISSVST